MLIFSSCWGKQHKKGFNGVQVCHCFRPCFLSHGQRGKQERKGWIKPSGQLTGTPGADPAPVPVTPEQAQFIWG